MTLFDFGGLVGVLLILAAYALGQLEKLDMRSLPALLMNLGGSLLVLLSLVFKFNLSAAIVEGAWALLALYGLIRLGLSRK